MSLATRDHFGAALVRIAEKDPRVVVVNCDLGSATRTHAFRDKFPERFFECGIGEANAISVAAGLAQEGFRPFVCSFGHFLTGKFLEIFQSVGLNQTGVVLVGTHAGLAIGKDGPSQMGLRDVALMRLLPGLEIVQPVDGVELGAMMDWLCTHSRPAYLRLCRQPTAEVFSQGFLFEPGAPRLLTKGESILLIGQGATAVEALEASRLLKKEGISVSVLNLSSLPYQESHVVELIGTHRAVLVIEDHYIRGALAEAIAWTLASHGVGAKLARIGVADYAQAGDPQDLYRHYGLDAAGIARTAAELLK